MFHLDRVRATVRCINQSLIKGLKFSQYSTVSCDSVENRVQGRIIGLKLESVTGGWRKLYEEHYNSYSLPYVVRMTK